MGILYLQLKKMFLNYFICIQDMSIHKIRALAAAAFILKHLLENELTVNKSPP